MVPVLGAAISAGAGLIGGIANLFGANKANKRQMQFQREMLANQQAYNDSVLARQMAYQDKVNAQNFAWNDERNVRQRIEAAGYNPYLYGQGSSGAAQGVSMSSGSASMASAGGLNEYSGFGDAVASLPGSFQDFLLKGKQVDAQDISNRSAEYGLQKTIDNDNVTVDGYRSYFSSGRQSIFKMQDAVNQANISAAKAFTDNLRKMWLEAPAADADGQPLIDAEGNPVSNSTALNDAERTSALKNLERLSIDILKGKQDIENLKADKLIKKYQLDKLLPAQLDEVRSHIDTLRSQVIANNAQAASSIAAAANMYESAETTRSLRPFQVGSASWRNQSDKYDALSGKLDYKYQQKYMPLEFDNFKTSTSTKRGGWGYFDAGLGTFGQLLGGAAQAASAYRGFRGRR